MSTPMSMTTTLDPDENDKAVDQREYRSIIDSLLYFTTTQLDIQFAVCLCACFQASARSSHWQVVQRIFRYLKYTLKFGIWYSSSSSLDLVGFFDADFVGCGTDQKKYFWSMPFSWIFSYLLVFSETNHYCTIHHRGQVCSCC
jgi:hypothetical protein